MSEQEPFLSRWSRREREAATEEAVPQQVETAANGPALDGAAEERKPETFDPATLPPIESIDALSDVRAFLQEGVPAEMKRAALRHVWAVDPSIRDFVGLAENAWDFTDPNAMPGFGPLGDGEDVRRMIAEVVDQIGQPVRPADGAEGSGRPSDTEAENSSNETVGAGPHATSDRLSHGADEGAFEVGTSDLLQSGEKRLPPAEELTQGQNAPKPVSYRGHGRALPQ
jgi:hypothetical protein